ncbi:hypothetical protein [Serratia sp. M24T3]|uniref:hypothetical protein n=1 Tax=Serratia sp. M24T3 TaxID=932213 RepID=UPI00025B8F49|nr:hypothetical protein [Serratia sp. M24T3]EIC83999.1 hypothetical protein SPM24T3_13820 [Serratia sp. M24T3]
MTIDVTTDELKTAIQADDVTALIVSKITEAKTVGLADAVATSIATLFPDSTDPSADASASSTAVAVDDSADDEGVVAAVA